jgi:hypothetical protein
MMKEDFEQAGELTSSFWERYSLVGAGWMIGGRCEDKGLHLAENQFQIN